MKFGKYGPVMFYNKVPDTSTMQVVIRPVSQSAIKMSFQSSPYGKTAWE